MNVRQSNMREIGLMTGIAIDEAAYPKRLQSAAGLGILRFDSIAFLPYLVSRFVVLEPSFEMYEVSDSSLNRLHRDNESGWTANNL